MATRLLRHQCCAEEAVPSIKEDHDVSDEESLN